MAPLYAVDTNLYIRALWSAEELLALRRFLLRIGSRIRLHAVVAMELRAGARTRAQETVLAALFEPYVERDRLLVPRFEAYQQAGRVMADLAVEERFDAGAAGTSFTNDVVIAASCRETGVTLVTGTYGDFARIKRHLRGFRVESPWPGA